MSMDGQGTKWRRRIAKNFIRLSSVQECYRHVFFWFSLNYFVLMLFAFVAFRFCFFNTMPKRLTGKNISEMTYFCVK